MLRVLLIILSVVAVILAYALGQPLLYLLALVLIAGSATLTTSQMKKRHANVPESFMKAPDVQEDDLGSLGILEIRPRDVSGSSIKEAAETPARPPRAARTEGQQVLDFVVRDEAAPAEARATGTAEARATSPAEPRPLKSKIRPMPSPAKGDSDATEIVGEVRTRRPRARIMVSEAAPDQDADVLIPALSSLRAGLDAYTVCLLRQEEAPLRYRVEAVVSQNSYARAQGSFSTNEPLVSGQPPFTPVIHARVGSDNFPSGRLGYYHEPISVRQVAMVVINLTETDDSYILVVDTMNDGGLETEAAEVLLHQYGRLLQTLLDSAVRSEPEVPSEEQELKPRRDIIADEMEKARKEAHPLALALVFLNRGEEVSDAATPDIRELESAFEARLREVASAGRVEQFGELTYGVFYHGDVETVASWASSLQTSFVDAEGHLRGGVSVGVALMNSRHAGPDDLRSDATAALQEAFQTGACTIVE